MAVLLESDRNTPAQGHLDELAARTTVLFVVTGILTVAWSFSWTTSWFMMVAATLRRVPQRLRPPVECGSVDDGSVGIGTGAPVGVYHLLSFSKPGCSPTNTSHPTMDIFGFLRRISPCLHSGRWVALALSSWI